MLSKIMEKENFIKRYSTEIQAIAIVILVFVTGFYAISTKNMADIMRDEFNASKEQLETRVTAVEISTEEFFNRQVVEVFEYEDIEKFNFYKQDNVNHLEVILKSIPIKNSVTLWFADNLTNPTNYDITDNVINIKLVDWIDMDIIKTFSEQDENIIVVSYVKAKNTDK